MTSIRQPSHDVLYSKIGRHMLGIMLFIFCYIAQCAVNKKGFVIKGGVEASSAS